LFGCDEFFSFLFSVGNSIGVLIGITRASKIDSGDSNFYLKAIYTHAAVAIIIWLFSAQFHARETNLSELLDYFGVRFY
jgi:hypothetical protein